MTTSELDTRNIAISMRKSVENLVISSQDAIGQSISQAVTFSGIITQHNNIQEIRNVSRSPSPSLRASETGVEVIDNDKDFHGNLIEASLFQGAEMAIHVPSQPAADNISVSSANSIAPSTALVAKNDIGKVTSSVSSARTSDSGGGGVRTKKKSWYNALYPTYKSKSDDFKRLFKDLPDDERLIVDYSCALQKDILAHGRLYASQNYLCFYANIFGWETNVSLRWKDVTAITKEKTALVIPNAILICTEGEKNFLTSFSGRDKAYLMLFRIWQNALMDQPMSSQEIWQWVHSCYGEELGFNSDDEGYGRDFTDFPVTALTSDTAVEDILDTSSIDVSGDGHEDTRPSRSSQGRDSSPTVVENGDGVYREEPADALPTDMSDTTDSEPDKHHNPGESEKCTSPHDGKMLYRGTFPFNIDQLFTMIFTNSKFNLELLAARSTSDYVQAPWQPQGGLKCRQINYTLGLTSGPIGPKEVQVTETQVMNKCSKPGVLYSIDCSSENAGIPYADYFTVDVHYCLQRRAESSTTLQVFCQVKYKKSMWPMVKAFLEKSTYSGTEEYVRLLEARLMAEAEVQAPAKRKGRRTRRATSSSQETTPSVVVKSPAATLLAPRTATPRAPPAHANSWLLGILLLLLLINALLYWRLYYAERQQYRFDLDDLQNRLSSLRGAQTAEWSRLLEQHSVRQRGQLLAWRDALANAVSHLAHTEQALTKLLESIKPSLERAQKEASEHKEL